VGPKRRWIDTLTTLLIIFTMAPAGYALTGQAVSTPVRLDSRPPVIAIDYPVGGEAFEPAAVETLQWSIQEDYFSVNPPPVVLAIVTGDSSLWTQSISPHSDPDYWLPWQVVDRAAAQARFVVQATDEFGWTTAESSATFSILGQPTGVTTGDHAGGDHNEVSGLGPILPNPFNPVTVLHFALARAATVDLAIFDVTGRKVAVLAQGPRPAGRHALRWDGRDLAGRRAASGTYLARLQVIDEQGAVNYVQRLTLLK
jgi:hypothetical protein